MAKLLGTNVGTIQQDLSILLKDESIEVSKQVIVSNPKYGLHLLTNFTWNKETENIFLMSASFGKREKLRKHKQTVGGLSTNSRPTNGRQSTDKIVWEPVLHFYPNFHDFSYNTYRNTENVFHYFRGHCEKNEGKVTCMFQLSKRKMLGFTQAIIAVSTPC